MQSDFLKLDFFLIIYNKIFIYLNSNVPFWAVFEVYINFSINFLYDHIDQLSYKQNVEVLEMILKSIS